MAKQYYTDTKYGGMLRIFMALSFCASARSDKSSFLPSEFCSFAGVRGNKVGQKPERLEIAPIFLPNCRETQESATRDAPLADFGTESRNLGYMFLEKSGQKYFCPGFPERKLDG